MSRGFRDQSNNHAAQYIPSVVNDKNIDRHLPVKIIEETQKIESKFEEDLLFVWFECAEDFCCVVYMILVHDPRTTTR